MALNIHEAAVCRSEHVGDGTSIGAFSHVSPTASLGQGCVIHTSVFVGGEVELGDRVTLMGGVQLDGKVDVENDVWLGPNVAIALCETSPGAAPETGTAAVHIGQNARIGANSTLMPGVHVGRYAVVSAGSVVTLNVPPYAIVSGNPARITGYVDSLKTLHEVKAETRADVAEVGVRPLSVRGASLHVFPTFEDARGRLSVGNFSDDVPFKAERFFMTYGVPSRYVRGEHAHRSCKQFLICVAGYLRLVLDDGRIREEVVLDRPDLGVYIPPMVWGSQYDYSADAVLLVFASHRYNAGDYIRDYDEFLQLTSSPGIE